MRPNRPMSAVERFFERLVERPSARLFGTRVQPVQVQRRIERAMELGRSSAGGSTMVPDRFTVRISVVDHERLGRLPSLPVELASSALEWARHRGYVLLGRPRVAIVGDAHLRRGDIDVEARYSDVGASPELEDSADLGRTRVFVAPVVHSPRASLAIRDADGRESTVIADGGPLSIGRSAGNTVVLADERVSRQHARLQARGGVLVLIDLASSNGTRVNGERITEVVVGAGDVIEIGGARITILDVDDGAPADPASVAGHRDASDGR